MRKLLLALGFAGAVGCSSMQPVGPFAKQPPLTQQGRPIPGVSDAVPVPAVRPTPPALYVQPGDVTADNVPATLEALTAEYSADSKSMPTGPITVETSVYRGGVKQK